MKNAQEILQFSGYPLEPIVAREIKKTLDAKLKNSKHPLTPYIKMVGGNHAGNPLQWDAAWFGNYE